MSRSTTKARRSLATTPSLVKWTLSLTLILSLLTPLSRPLFVQVLHIPSLDTFLHLTAAGIQKGWVWQLISYLFIQPSHHKDFSLLFHLFLNLYFLWVLGKAIVAARGNLHFVGLYLLGGLFLGAVAYLFLSCSHSPLPFAGATSAIYILMVGWIFLDNNNNKFIYICAYKYIQFSKRLQYPYVHTYNGNH